MLCYFVAEKFVCLATVIYFTTGITLVVVTLSNSETITNILTSNSKRPFKLFYIIYILTLLIVCNWVLNVFRLNLAIRPLDKNMADMLFFIKEMANNYIDNKPVYGKIANIWGTPINTVYLPAFWLPYVLPLSYGADMRWATLIASVSSFWVIIYTNRRYFNNYYFLLLLTLIMFIYLLLSDSAFYFMYIQEGIMLFYIALLGYALINNYWYIAGIAASLCLLSRYFIIAPLTGALIWLYFVDRSAAQKVFVATTLTIVSLVLLSRTSGDIGFFFQIPGLYYKMLSNSNIANFNFYKTVGFASFFTAKQVGIISLINSFCILFVPAIFFICAFIFLRETNTSKGIIVLCGLKLFWLFFSTTLTIPYAYILYTSSFISIILLKSSIVLHSEIAYPIKK